MITSELSDKNLANKLQSTAQKCYLLERGENNASAK